VITLHYLWVVRTAVAFEDASVEYAEKRAARVAAWRSGQRRVGATATKARPGPFPLPSLGRPEIAFLWKNLLSTWQYFTLRTLLTFHPHGTSMPWLTPTLRIVAGAGLALIVPTLVAMQLLVPNAAALLFPGWFQLSRGRGGGPEVIGQRMIFFFAQLITMLLALLPAAAMGALLVFVLQWLLGPIAAVGIATVAVFAVLA